MISYYNLVVFKMLIEEMRKNIHRESFIFTHIFIISGTLSLFVDLSYQLGSFYFSLKDFTIFFVRQVL